MEESFVCSGCGKANDSAHLCVKGGGALDYMVGEKETRDKQYIERLLDEVLGKVSFYGDTYYDGLVIERLDLYNIALNHIQRRLSSLHYDCEDRPEISAREIKSKLERMNKITPFLSREEES